MGQHVCQVGQHTQGICIYMKVASSVGQHIQSIYMKVASCVGQHVCQVGRRTHGGTGFKRIAHEGADAACPHSSILK